MEQNLSDSKKVGVVYAFSEANHAVFQNAGAWKLERDLGVSTWAYAPREYQALFWSAEKTFQISPPPYRSSREIQELQLNLISRKNFRSWISQGSYHFFKGRIMEFLPAKMFHFLPASFRHDYKSKHFLFESGIYNLCKVHFERNAPHGSEFLGTTFYTNPGNLVENKRNLKMHFQISFQNLSDQIRSGTLANFEIDTIILEEDEKSCVKEILEFVHDHDHVIFLRTRNVDNDVRFQNADPAVLNPVIDYLLDKKISIIHSGTPPVRLGIEHPNYLEVSHSLPVGIELALAQECDLVMQSAWAGLFTAVATLKTSLVTFDEEWSQVNLPHPVSLMDARKSAGMQDLALGSALMDTSSLEDVGKKILALLSKL
jgi:hypothetical protein